MPSLVEENCECPGGGARAQARRMFLPLLVILNLACSVGTYDCSQGSASPSASIWTVSALYFLGTLTLSVGLVWATLDELGSDFCPVSLVIPHSKESFHACLNLVFMIFIFRERGKGGERQGEKHWCGRRTLVGCLSHVLPLAHVPTGDQNLQPRHVPWPGLRLVTFAEWRSTNRATPVGPFLFQF